MRRLGVAITLSFLLGTIAGGFSGGFDFSSAIIILPAVLYFSRKRCTLFILFSCAAFFMLGVQRRAIYSERVSPAEQFMEKKALHIRNHISGKLSERLDGESSRGIAAALLIGDRSGLDSEIKTAFRNAGISHTLALSGMHVGIIWSMVCLMLSFMKFSYRTRHLATALSILLIFAYAAITGLSPSVSRACIMLAVWKIAQTAAGEKDRLAPVLIAAMAITLVNPRAAESISFQLSFLAVLGIVFIYPVFDESINIVLKIKRKRTTTLKGILAKSVASVAKLCGISLSCQIATLPLILLYFGKISGIFLLSNIVAAPLVTFSVIGSAASAALGSIPHLGHWISDAASLMIELLKNAVLFLGS